MAYADPKTHWGFLPTTLECLAVGLWCYFHLHHHMHALLAGYLGLMSVGGYMALHMNRGTFWIVALCGIGIWGTFAVGVAMSIWPNDLLPKVVFACLGGGYSVLEKFNIHLTGRLYQEGLA